MTKIKISIVGGGKAGTAVLESFLKDERFAVVSVVDAQAENCLAAKTILTGTNIAISKSLETAERDACGQIDYFIDFSSAAAVYENALTYVRLRASFIICASGLNAVQKAAIESKCLEEGIKGAIIPNASTLAVLGMYFDKIAAPFVADINITETHDASKADAPSGTAYNTLVECARQKGCYNFNDNDFVMSGDGMKNSQFIRHKASGIEVYANRPHTGGVATQTVELRSEGQKLTIEHVAYNRQSYKEGVALAITYLEENGGFIQGLEKAMGLV